MQKRNTNELEELEGNFKIVNGCFESVNMVRRSVFRLAEMLLFGAFLGGCVTIWRGVARRIRKWVHRDW